MSITKQKIMFDPSAPTENDRLGAFLIGAGGTVIASTSSSLNVNLTNASIAVTASDLDVRDLTHVSDSVKVGDGTDFLAIAADGSIAVTDNGTTLSIDDGAGSITVDASDLDIRDLTHVSDSVKVGDGTDFLAINADGSINVNVTENVSNGAIKNSAETVTASVAQVLSTPLAGRTDLMVENLGSQSVYLLSSAIQTIADGIEIPKYANSPIMPIDANAALYMASASGSQSVRFMEFKR